MTSFVTEARMLYRMTFWLAVSALIALGCTTALTTLIRSFWTSAGWQFYSPYAVPSPSSVDLIYEFCAAASTWLLPIAVFSSAAYIIMLDRRIRQPSHRGFPIDVNSAASAPDPMTRGAGE